jgi:glycosyltransferase involved in cell wall biosynthesis
VVILHDDPMVYAGIFAEFPHLRNMRVIGYCVWEGSRLPEAYAQGLRLVGEVWTCSRYSRESISKLFPEVAIVPHVVQRSKTTVEELEYARRLIGEVEAGEFLFFSIIDAVNPRKNIRDLLFAFSQVRSQTRRKARLILKQYRAVMDFSSIPGVSSITEDLPAGSMHALHMLCHAYVSAHHIEGWGLGMSEAMAYGKPVIATGYSGNMDYMNDRNSFPVPFSLKQVSEEMCRILPLFTPDMVWADVDKEALILTMKRVVDGGFDASLPAQAAAISQTFGTASVARIIQSLLEK